jgi:predicted polyphosphate/ATP-dependent NAD kinase
MQREQVELILFAGGDGTARDIYHAVGNEFPVLGIPAGVKIFSAAFGISPKRAGELAGAYLRDKHVPLREVEVLDLDEAAYRQGIISPQLYGTLLVPFERRRLQSQKAPTPFSESAQAQAIAARVIAEMAPGQAYLLGPGTTTRAVADRLGIANTLVGADIVTRDEALALDVGEGQILDMLSRQPLGMIVTPTGGQGFLFGRGNQQFSPEVLKLVGRENIVVISLPGKIAAQRGRPLLIDTGDEDTDRYLEGYFDIISGYHERIVYRVAAAG